MSLVSAFTSAVLPILAIMGLGYGLAQVVDLDVESLNAIALYAFLPALVFHSLTTTSLEGGTILSIAGGVGIFVAVMVVVAEGFGHLVGVDEPFRSADVLASSFPNAGFYGIPLAEFAFGSVGRTTAVVFMTVQTFLMYTAGVYIASRGGGQGGTSAVSEIFKLPLIYAIVAALAVRWAGIAPPDSGTLMTTILLVGNASIPLMLVIVGIQLAGIELTALSRVGTPSLLKLGVAPLVGTGVAFAVLAGTGDVARVFILLSATPVAVVPLALTITYSDRSARDGLSASEYLTTTIFVTTLASVPVLTVLITLLRSGVPL